MIRSNVLHHKTLTMFEENVQVMTNSEHLELMGLQESSLSSANMIDAVLAWQHEPVGLQELLVPKHMRSL